jgi:hypothetical protein
MLSLMPEKFIIPVACTNAKIHQKVSAAFFRDSFDFYVKFFATIQFQSFKHYLGM